MLLAGRMHRIAQWACSAVVVIVSGCGGDDLNRYPVQGTVTFGGKNVEAGQVMFEPDVELGMVAPAGYARIEDGAYTIQRDQGPVAGRYRFRITAFDMSRVKSAGPEGADVPLLFPEYVTTATIPLPDDRFDIEVPTDLPNKRL